MGGDDRYRAVDLRCADLLGHILAIQDDALADAQCHRPRDPRTRLGVGDVGARLERQ